jgi:hypothetical protein
MLERYPPLPLRRRLLIVLLALATTATTATLWYALICRPGDTQRWRAPAPPADRPVCAEGRSAGCVGGMAQVISVTPQAAPASRALSRQPRAASARPTRRLCRRPAWRHGNRRKS